jgi:hypothetical protein
VALTEEDIAECVELWQQRLHLTEWEIQIDFDSHCEESAAMDISKTWDYNIARLRLGPNWREWSQDNCTLDDDDAIVHRSLDRLVVHELLHLLFREMDFATTQRMLEDHLHRDVEAVADKAYEHAQENVIECLARVLVDAYP